MAKEKELKERKRLNYRKEKRQPMDPGPGGGGM